MPPATGGKEGVLDGVICLSYDGHWPASPSFRDTLLRRSQRSARVRADDGCVAHAFSDALSRPVNKHVKPRAPREQHHRNSSCSQAWPQLHLGKVTLHAPGRMSAGCVDVIRATELRMGLLAGSYAHEPPPRQHRGRLPSTRGMVAAVMPCQAANTCADTYYMWSWRVGTTLARAHRLQTK